MEQSFTYKVLKTKTGQSTVEYILLLAVIVGLGVTIFNNKKFKDLLAGKDGLFLSFRKGMEYSYRYGRMQQTNAEYTQGMAFEYTDTKHDTYFNSGLGQTHFFLPTTKYP